jgi:hypothetical protein
MALKNVGLMVTGALVALSAIAIPLGVASAQDTDKNELCDLLTPAVRDVVQDAPLIKSILNLDPALPDATIDANRAQIGCATPAPRQTPEQARGEVCEVLVEARVEDVVEDLNNPDATTALETVRPGLRQILVQARVQMKCDEVATPAAREKDGPAPTTVPPARQAPRGPVATGGI